MRWRFSKRLKYLGEGDFSPSGISFTTLIIDLLACRRGIWDKTYSYTEDVSPNSVPPRIQLKLDFSENDQTLINEYLLRLDIGQIGE